MERQRAWAGLWSLVWRSRLTLRRAPRLLALTLILPGLAAVLGRLRGRQRLPANPAQPPARRGRAPDQPDHHGGTDPGRGRTGNPAYLCVRPLRRSVFFLLFHAGHLLWLELTFLLSGLLLLGVGFWQQVPGINGLAIPFLLAQAAGLLAFSSLSAVTGMLTRRYLVLGLLYGAVIEIGVGGIPTNINVLSLAHHVRVVVSTSETASAFLVSNQGNASFSFFVLIAVGLVGAGTAASIYSCREFIAGPDA